MKQHKSGPPGNQRDIDDLQQKLHGLNLDLSQERESNRDLKSKINKLQVELSESRNEFDSLSEEYGRVSVCVYLFPVTAASSFEFR